MNEKDENHKLDQIVFDGIKFLESITSYYGSDRGMEVWNAMGEAMGREVKGKIFFAMLTGASTGRIRFQADAAWSTSGPSNAVPVIKCIRNYTGFGLKEAKDRWDLSKDHVVEIECAPDVQRDFARELRVLGCKVS